MKIKAYLSLDILRCTKEKIIKIDDDEIDGMTEEQKNEYINEIVNEWIWDQIDAGWKEI